MPEIEESELLAHRNVTALFNEMLANPAVRSQLLPLVKKTRPNAAIPEVDAAAPLQGALSELRTEIDAVKKAREEDKAERELAAKRREWEAGWEKQRSALRQAGWTDDGIKQVEEHAEKEGIPNLRAAAADWEKLHPPGEPVQPNGFGTWGFFDGAAEESDGFLKKMMESRGEDEGAVQREAMKALQEHRSASGGRR